MSEFRDGSVERRGLRITGRVQGVGFRWFTRTSARGLEVRGAVRNRADGSVEVHAQGSEAALDRLEEALREGPPSARVRAVERVASSLPVPDDDFIICR